ncbi:MAG: methyltransferase [Ginsengibacter sp.]
MKVCTDSCVFGAYVAQKITDGSIKPKNILDIGSGTGLLSLMLAQKSTANIEAVEIEENAFLQSSENFLASPSKQHLKVFHKDIKNLDNSFKYDLIISNPPFFENDLKPGQKNTIIAKHDESLDLAELMAVIKIHLTTEGKFAVMLPYFRIEYFKSLLEKNHFIIEEELLLRHSASHSPFRGIFLVGQTKTPLKNTELMIRNEVGAYTDEFNFLLKDYYL